MPTVPKLMEEPRTFPRMLVGTLLNPDISIVSLQGLSRLLPRQLEGATESAFIGPDHFPDKEPYLLDCGCAWLRGVDAQVELLQTGPIATSAATPAARNSRGAIDKHEDM